MLFQVLMDMVELSSQIKIEIYSHPNHPNRIDRIPSTTRIIITHFIRPMDALIMPRITENPRSIAMTRIIIPIQIQISITIPNP